MCRQICRVWSVFTVVWKSFGSLAIQRARKLCRYAVWSVFTVVWKSFVSLAIQRARTQLVRICRHICSVWSVFTICMKSFGSLAIQKACRLCGYAVWWVFTICMTRLWVLGYPKSPQIMRICSLISLHCLHEKALGPWLSKEPAGCVDMQSDQSSLFAWKSFGSLAIQRARSMCGYAVWWAFTICMKKLWVLGYPKSLQVVRICSLISLHYLHEKALGPRLSKEPAGCADMQSDQPSLFAWKSSGSLAIQRAHKLCGYAVWSAFTICMKKLWVLGYPKSLQILRICNLMSLHYLHEKALGPWLSKEPAGCADMQSDEPSLFAWKSFGSLAIQRALRLCGYAVWSAFTICMKKLWVLGYPKSPQVVQICSLMSLHYLHEKALGPWLSKEPAGCADMQSDQPSLFVWKSIGSLAIQRAHRLCGYVVWSAFTIFMKKLWVLGYPKSPQVVRICSLISLHCCMKKLCVLGYLKSPQIVRMCRHICRVWSVFTICMKKLWVLGYPKRPQEDWSDCADVQADFRLCWAHMLFCMFCWALALDYTYQHFLPPTSEF